MNRQCQDGITEEHCPKYATATSETVQDTNVQRYVKVRSLTYSDQRNCDKEHIMRMTWMWNVSNPTIEA